MNKTNTLFFTLLISLGSSCTSYSMTPLVRKCIISDVSSTAIASCYHPSNRWFIVGFEDGDTIAYDCHTGKKKKTLHHGIAPVTTITVSEDESLIAIGASTYQDQGNAEIVILKRNNQGEYFYASTINAGQAAGDISRIVIPKDNKSCLIQCDDGVFFVDLEYFISSGGPTSIYDAMPRYLDMLWLGRYQFVYLQEKGNLSKPSNKCLNFFIHGTDIDAYQTSSDLYTDEDGDQDRFTLLDTPIYDDFKEFVSYRPCPQAFFIENNYDKTILLLSSLYHPDNMTPGRCGYQTFVMDPEEETFTEITKKDIPIGFQQNNHLQNDHGWATVPYKLNDRYYILGSITRDGFKLELFDTYKCYSISEYYLKTEELGEFCYAYSAQDKYFVCFLQEDGSLHTFTFNFISEKRYSRLLWRPIGKKKGACKNNGLKRFMLKDREDAEPYLECIKPLSELKQLEAEINENDSDEEALNKFLGCNSNSDSSDSDSSDSDSSDSDSSDDESSQDEV